MNNIRFGSLILATAGVVWLTQSSSLKGKQAENQKLTHELAQMQEALQTTSKTWTNTEAELKSRRDELKSADAELRIATQEIQDIPVMPVDPEHEGSWPQDQPYFFLSKRFLDQIGYSPFSREGDISPAAGFLFGMSPKEKQQVDDAIKTMRTKANQLQRSKAERIEPKPGVNTDNHREVSYKIATMTNEVQELRNDFSSAVRHAIGDTRGEMFLVRAAAFFEDDYSGNFGRNDYVITSMADRKPDGTIQYNFTLTEPGVGTMYFPFEYPLEPGTPPWDNRHLFGETPLIPSSESKNEAK